MRRGDALTLQIRDFVNIVHDVKVSARLAPVFVDGGPVERPSSLSLRVVVPEAGRLSASGDLRRRNNNVSTAVYGCSEELGQLTKTKATPYAAWQPASVLYPCCTAKHTGRITAWYLCPPLAGGPEQCDSTVQATLPHGNCSDWRTTLLLLPCLGQLADSQCATAPSASGVFSCPTPAAVCGGQQLRSATPLHPRDTSDPVTILRIYSSFETVSQQ